MWEQAGPFRTEKKLAAALARIEEMRRRDLPRVRIGAERRFNVDLHDVFELRAMLTTAEAVVRSALARRESRGAHQREDFPSPDEAFLKNQVIEMKGNELVSGWISPIRLSPAGSHNG